MVSAMVTAAAAASVRFLKADILLLVVIDSQGLNRYAH
jgi:hypothetical protein